MVTDNMNEWINGEFVRYNDKPFIELTNVSSSLSLMVIDKMNEWTFCILANFLICLWSKKWVIHEPANKLYVLIIDVIYEQSERDYQNDRTSLFNELFVL